MPGRINEEDLATVRDRAKIEDVVGSYVALRSAGGGSLKGLCPFHDEKSPSFHVTPSRGFYYCFGACGEGGDVITFMQKVENLSFAESVQRLADRVGIVLRFTEDDGGPRTEPGLRMKLLDAHREAAEFFVNALGTAEALPARQFLAQRGFDRAAAEHFGVGFAPRDGRRLTQHLRGRGFTENDLIAGGLTRKGGYDFFTGRVLWPIRDTGKSVIGFGARRIFDDDRLPAKYINTPETPLYKKSQVLYGLDLARLPIGKKSQAVIVEGYTDVMAAHLSGVDTAVASCGTAFGDDHARLLRRLMGNHDAFHGEVIFTFDGDAAGQAAALKVFRNDESFIAQTYVAVDPHELDPCDLRLQHGEAAVRELVGRRTPLYKFVMGNVLSRFDLDRTDGRIGALREAAPLVASIRDAGMVGGYTRDLAQMLGMDIEEVRAEVNKVASQASRRPAAAGQPSTHHSGPQQGAGEPTAPEPAPRPNDVLPDPRDRRLSTERETTKLLIQQPHLFGESFDGLKVTDFTHPAYGAVLRHAQRAVRADGTEGGFADWPRRVARAEDNPWVNSLVVALAVEPLLTMEPTTGYVTAHTAKLRLLTVMRQIVEVKSKLQRTNPVDAQSKYNQMFSELVVLEAERTKLQNLSLGAQD